MKWSSNNWPPGMSFRHQETRSGFTKWSCYVITNMFSAGQLSGCNISSASAKRFLWAFSRFLWAFLFF